MKITSAILLTAALAMGAVIAFAQDAGGERPPGGPRGPGGPGGPGGRRPMPAIIAALDANKDGKLDAAEIANASVALKALDKNGDGEISAEEMFGPRPEGSGGAPGRLPPPRQQ
jgi:hypothetical protein